MSDFGATLAGLIGTRTVDQQQRFASNILGRDVLLDELSDIDRAKVIRAARLAAEVFNQEPRS